MADSRRKHLFTALRILAIAAVVVCFVLFVREIDVDALKRALGNANPWPLIAVCALNFVMISWKTLCWRLLLAPHADVPFVRLFRYTLFALAVGIVVPARAGEAVRPLLLKRDGVPLVTAAAIPVAERLLDALAMLMVVAPIPFLMPWLPGWVVQSIALVAVLGIGGLVATLIAFRYANPEKRFGRFMAGFAIVKRPHRAGMALGACMMAWVTDLFMIQLTLGAVGVHIPWEATLLVVLTINVAIMIPSTPANVGALQIGALVGLEMLGVPRADALAFALLYHAAQILPLLPAGLLQARVVSPRTQDVQQPPLT